MHPSVHFDIKRGRQYCTIASVPLTDITLLDPTTAAPLLDGEWLTYDPANPGKLMQDVGTNPAVVRTFCVDTEKGRSETQVNGMTDIIRMGEYQGNTKIYTPGALVINDFLMVNDVTYPAGSALTRRGLVKATSGGFVVAQVIAIDATNGILTFQTLSGWIVA